MAGTKIENASDSVLLADVQAAPTTIYLPSGKSGWTTSKKIAISVIDEYIRSLVDRIVDGDSYLQIEDGGSGAYLLVHLDGASKMAISAGSNGLLFTDPVSLTNEALDVAYVASGTNYIQIKAATTGNPVEINALGSDSTVAIKYSPKGAEGHDFYANSAHQISIEDGVVLPAVDNDIDLGSATYQFKDAYINGVGYIDSLQLTSGSTVTVIENTLTDTATYLPTSHAVYDAIHDNSGWQDAGTYVHLHTGTDKVYVGASGTTPTERMEIDGAIKIGTAAGTANGTIRYTGTDVEARIGGSWVSMTSSTGIVVKEAVVAASTANGTLASDFEDGDTLDGVTLTANDRILIKDQSTAAENGIYIVQASGAPVRATDMDDAAEFYNGYVFVTGGTANANSGWIETLTVTTVNTDPVAFQQFSASNSYTAGSGLQLVGSEFSIKHDGTSLSSSGSGAKVNPSVVPYLANNNTYSGDNDFDGAVDIAPVHETDAGTQFMVIEATTDQVKYRTAAEVASDIGAVTSDKYLSAVNVNSISDVDFVITNGVNIEGVSFAHTHAINDLSDVVITSVASGEVIQYNGSNWINRTLVEAGIEPTVTKGNLTETTSNVLTITGGTGAVIGSGVTIAVDLATPITNGDTTHLATCDAIYDFVIGLGYITGNQTITLSGDVTGSGTTAITTTIAANAVEAGMLNNNVISGQGSELTSGLQSTDELLISDAGTIKKMDISVLEDYLSLSSYDRWHSWTASRTSDTVITSATNIEEGTPIRYRATAGTWRYGIVKTRSGNDHTIMGYPCSGSDDNEFQYGNPELVQTIHFHISGAFASAATTAAATGGALYEYNKMKKHYQWFGAPGYIVGLDTICFEQDSSATEPTVDLERSTDNSTYNDIFSNAITITDSSSDTGVYAQSAYYNIERGNYLEFSITAGGNGDAKDVDFYVTVVLA